MLPIDKVSELLGLIDDNKKISFDQKYAENLYLDYNEQKCVDDSKQVNYISDNLANKEVLLIAPGKSVGEYKDKIKEISSNPNIITISLNLVEEFGQQYIVVTRKGLYDSICSNDRKLITLSSVDTKKRENVSVLDYKKWTEIVDGKVYDSSSVVAFKLIETAHVKKVYLAGFDGFSLGINDNYYEPEMRVQVLEKQANERNLFYKNRIRSIKDSGIDVIFVTPSKYE